MRNLTFAFFFCLSISVSAQRHGTGLIFNEENYAKAKVRANLNAQNFDSLPQYYSLKKFCPRPGNQLQLNTSPAWATAWSALSILQAQSSSDAKSIELSPAYLYHRIKQLDDRTCIGGIDLYDALQFIRINKLELFDDFKEFCAGNLPRSVLTNQSDMFRDFRKLFSEKAEFNLKINSVKKSLTQNLPVVIGMHCPPSFYTAKDYWNPHEMMSKDFPGHALCVVGYDDEKYGGAFEIINSWGSEWGNEGFLWIPYKDFIRFTRNAYEVFYVNAHKHSSRISGSIQLVLRTEGEVPLQCIEPGVFTSVKPFDNHSYFRVYLSNEMPVYVYLFGVDDQNNFFKVFPDADSISAALVYDSGPLAVPGQDKYIQVTGVPGKENLCILYSKRPINYENLMSNLIKYPGRLDENLDALLEGKIIGPEKIQWEPDGIKFSLKSDEDSIVFIQIHLKHI